MIEAVTDTFIELYVQGMDEEGHPDGKKSKVCVNAKDIVLFGVHWNTYVTYVRIQMGYETVDYLVENESHEDIIQRVMKCGTAQIIRVKP